MSGKLVNDSPSSAFKNHFATMIHPLAISPVDGKEDVLVIPAWIDSAANLVKRKLVFLEILKA